MWARAGCMAIESETLCLIKWICRCKYKKTDRGTNKKANNNSDDDDPTRIQTQCAHHTHVHHSLYSVGNVHIHKPNADLHTMLLHKKTKKNKLFLCVVLYRIFEHIDCYIVQIILLALIWFWSFLFACCLAICVILTRLLLLLFLYNYLLLIRKVKNSTLVRTVTMSCMMNIALSILMSSSNN